MRRQHCLAALAALTALTAAAVKPLDGFFYGRANAPGGHEWQAPDSLGYNKLAPRASFQSFANMEEALKVLPENSSYHLSLDGVWKFRWVPEPKQRDLAFFKPGFDASHWDDIEVPSNWNIAGLQTDGSQKWGTPIYVNQPVIFYHQVKPDDWRGGVMRTPPETWTTFKARNEVGQYRRTFTVPAGWKGREIYINFTVCITVFKIKSVYTAYIGSSVKNFWRFFMKNESCYESAAAYLEILILILDFIHK